jgi:hypothetical protein
MTEYTAWGIDYADGKGLTTAEMKANGVQFVCRYLSGGGAKDIHQEELSTLLGADVAVVLNWETWGQMPSGAQGVADATAAQQEAAGLGLGDAPIYFSADFDPTGKTASIDAYMRGVASVIGQERTGLYAGLAGIQAYFDAAIGKYGWQTCGWSAGQWDSRAQLQQWNINYQMGPAEVDQDRATTIDYGQTPRPATTTTSEDPDMSTQSSNGVVSLSFKPGSISHLQITADPATGPLPLRVMLALPTGPWIQNGGGGSAGDYTVSNGFATYSIAPAHVGACGGVMLESTQPNRVFSAVGF